jgi:hypothetical protein
MPQLSEVTYSQDACVAAVRSYYDFLTKMYLKNSDVIEPPQEGWPSITTEILQDLGKTETVISLLRHLPYIRVSSEDDRDNAQGAPWCYFADWQLDAHYVSLGHLNCESLKIHSENLIENVPPHVIGLTSGGRDNPVFLLDTELGIIHWPECVGEIRYNPSRELIEDDPYIYAPEDEAEWRADAPAWAIDDFFEVLKDQYRELCFVPTSPRIVLDTYTTLAVGTDGMIALLQDIYHEHGWPGLARYRKQECLQAVQKALEEQYPGHEDPRRDDE